METIKIYQTDIGNKHIFNFKSDPLFAVVTYDLIISEFIKVNRLFGPNQEWRPKSNSVDHWEDFFADFNLKQVVWDIYPVGSVTDLYKVRGNFKKRFLEGLEYLQTRTEPQQDRYGEVHLMPSVFIDDVVQDRQAVYIHEDNRDLIDFNLSPLTTYEVKSKVIPSPADMPAVLYRPHQQCRTARSFLYNRAMVLHFKMNEGHSRYTLIPIKAFPTWWHIQRAEEWKVSENRRWKDGRKMWITEEIQKPLETYGLFSVDELTRNVDGVECLKIIKMY